MSKVDKKISQKRSELAELLAWFESDDFNIEQAMEKLERAEQVALDIERELLEYKNTVTFLKQRFDSAEDT